MRKHVAVVVSATLCEGFLFEIQVIFVLPDLYNQLMLMHSAIFCGSILLRITELAIITGWTPFL